MLTLLRNFPWIGPLEWDLQQHGWTPENSERAEDVSLTVFGIYDDDTRPWIDDDGTEYLAGVPLVAIDAADRQRQLDEWEANFAPLRLFRDESAAFWRSVGWDVTDGEGRQLEVMRAVARPLICLIKQIHPGAVLHDQAKRFVVSLEDRLREEARTFRPS